VSHRFVKRLQLVESLVHPIDGLLTFVFQLAPTAQLPQWKSSDLGPEGDDFDVCVPMSQIGGAHRRNESLDLRRRRIAQRILRRVGRATSLSHLRPASSVAAGRLDLDPYTECEA
jgi:hypothetical protein